MYIVVVSVPWRVEGSKLYLRYHYLVLDAIETLLRISFTCAVRARVANEHERILHLASNAKGEPRICRRSRHVEVQIIARCVESKVQVECTGTLVLICVGRSSIACKCECEESKQECCRTIDISTCIMCQGRQERICLLYSKVDIMLPSWDQS